VAPLRPAEDAVIVDSTRLSIDEVLDRVLGEVRRVFPDLVIEARAVGSGRST
jgi:cytidylate kinase